MGDPFHLCICERLEAALYRRSAGDFDGRKVGDFRWQGSVDGPEARRWELAGEIDGEACSLIPPASEDEAEDEQSADQTSPCAPVLTEEGAHNDADSSYDDGEFCSEDSA